MLLLSLVFYIIAFFIIVFRAKIFLHEPNTNYLGKTNSNSIKAICSWGVVMYHVTNTVESGALFRPFQSLGFLMVAMFFFFSGFGLLYSLNHKTEYLKIFPKKRFIDFMLPYFISLLVTVLYLTFIYGDFSFTRIITQFIDGNPVVRYSWFVFVLLHLYIIFWVSFGLIKHRKASYFVFYVLSMAMAVNIFLPYWSPAIIAFVIGAFFAHKKDLVDKIVLKYSWLFLCLSSLVFATLTFLYIRRGDNDTNLYKVFLSIAFVFLIVSLLTRVQLDNVFLRFLCKISYEVYLYHGLITIILNQIPSVFNNPMLYISLVLPLTFITATIMYYLRVKLFKLFRIKGATK